MCRVATDYICIWLKVERESLPGAAPFLNHLTSSASAHSLCVYLQHIIVINRGLLCNYYANTEYYVTQGTHVSGLAGESEKLALTLPYGQRITLSCGYSEGPQLKMRAYTCMYVCCLPIPHFKMYNTLCYDAPACPCYRGTY